MYLLTIDQEKRVVEASLGGRVTALELRVMSDELISMLDDQTERFELLLDYALVLPLDSAAHEALGEMKDRCLASRVNRIVSIPNCGELSDHVAPRLQQVMEGKEQFLSDIAAYQPHEQTAAPAATRRKAKRAA